MHAPYRFGRHEYLVSFRIYLTQRCRKRLQVDRIVDTLIERVNLNKTTNNFSGKLYLLEAVLYIGVGILLTAATTLALIDAGALFWRGIVDRAFNNCGLVVLDRLLMVLMLVEVLRTVRTSIYSKEFML
jgi:hypothetical protein